MFSGHPTEWGHLLSCVILTLLDVQQVEHDKTAEHLWPLDLISVEEGDTGKQRLLHSPHQQQELCTGFFSLLLFGGQMQ